MAPAELDLPARRHDPPGAERLRPVDLRRPTIERDIGRVSTLAVFLVTGVFAAATSFAFAPGFVVAVGASGAIFGLVGAFVAYNYLRGSTCWRRPGSAPRCRCSSSTS